MKTAALSQKSHSILEAIATGRSCQEILEGDRSLTYHDIFHAVSEVPTSYWKRPAGKPAGKELLRTALQVRTAAKQRFD